MATVLNKEPKQQNRFIIFDMQGIFIGNKFHVKEVCVSISDFEVRTFPISTVKKHSKLTNKDIMVNTWRKGYSAVQDVIVYLTTTLKK